MHVSCDVLDRVRRLETLNIQPPKTLQWRHNRRSRESIHRPNDCLLSRLFSCRSKKTSKLHVTGLCAGNSAVTGEFHAQMANSTENVSLWWRHHDMFPLPVRTHSFTGNVGFVRKLCLTLWPVAGNHNQPSLSTMANYIIHQRVPVFISNTKTQVHSFMMN